MTCRGQELEAGGVTVVSQSCLGKLTALSVNVQNTQNMRVCCARLLSHLFQASLHWNLKKNITQILSVCNCVSQPVLLKSGCIYIYQLLTCVCVCVCLNMCVLSKFWQKCPGCDFHHLHSQPGVGLLFVWWATIGSKI